MNNAELPRGVRLNNPGNIEHGDGWNGLADDQPDERFCKFTSPAWGFRAMAMILVAYQDKHAITTIDGAIRRWSETDQDAYVKDVSAASHKGALDKVNFHDYNDAYSIIRAMTIQEQGGFEKYFTKAQLDVGCIKAGLENAPRGVVGSVVKLGGTVTAAGAAAVASDPGALYTIWSNVKPIVDVAPSVIQKGFWVVAVATVVALVIGEVSRIRNRKG